jgi:hypothetical protein
VHRDVLVEREREERREKKGKSGLDNSPFKYKKQLRPENKKRGTMIRARDEQQQQQQQQQ